MSSRSIASARQKRAGDPVSVATTNRPGTYPGPQKNSQQASQPYNQKQQQNQVPLTKISISDAIGLITLRLGRAEQFIQQQTHDNESSSSSSGAEKTIPLDKTIINNLLSRVDSIEKREPVPVDTTKIVKIEQELRDIKDLLMIHVMKFEKFVLEMQDKSQKMEAQFEEKLNRLEKQIIQPVSSSEVIIEVLAESQVTDKEQLDDTLVAEVKEDKRNGKKNKYTMNL